MIGRTALPTITVKATSMAHHLPVALWMWTHSVRSDSNGRFDSRALTLRLFLTKLGRRRPTGVVGGIPTNASVIKVGHRLLSSAMHRQQ